MTPPRPWGPAPPYTGTRIDRIGVVVPVHNDEQALEQCLDALDIAVSRVTVPVTVIAVLDACTDDSAAVVRGFPAAGTETIVIDAGQVGFARAAGMTELLRRHGESGTWLATTDGDSIVPSNWLTAQLRHADAGARVVAGTVRVDGGRGRTDGARARKMDPRLHGANLSFAAAAYCATDGFQPVGCDGDVLLVEAFKANGEPIAWAIDLPVVTSSRRDRSSLAPIREGGA
jgi:GT2 family glycosyltransferase